MIKIKSFFNRSNIGPMIIIVLILLSLYGLTMSRFFAASPSKGFSREIKITEVFSGKNEFIESHVSSLVLPDDTVLITAVDNQRLKIIKVSSEGKVIEENLIDLNLYHARELSTTIDKDGNLILIYLEGDLYKAVIDLETQDYQNKKIVEDVDFFIQEGDVVVYLKASDLYGMNINDPSNVMPILTGPIKSYEMDQDPGTGVYHLMATIRNSIEVDIVYIQFDESLEIKNNFIIAEASASTYLKYIRGLYVDDGRLTAIFVWSDPLYGKNNLTVHQYDTQTSEKITDYRREFSSHNSPFTILDVREDQVKILLQETVHYGVNIVEVLISKDEESKIKPLTKTRRLSMTSNYFEVGEDQALVFFDMVDNKKIIYFASSNQELINKTTKALSINPIRIICIIFIVGVLSGFFGAVYYILACVIGPFLLLLLMNKYLPNIKPKEYFKSLVSLILHIALKLYLIYYIIHGLGTYILRPPIIGHEPYIYIFMVLTSILSYLLMVRHYRWNIEYEASITLSYIHFLFYEYIIFTLSIFIYIVTYMVIGKI